MSVAGPADRPATERSPAEVTIYTDGACKGNPGPGGWAAVLLAGRHRKEIAGYEPDTTNNRMELRAAIEALRATAGCPAVTIVTDSSYVQNGVTRWLAGWKRNGWRTADKKPAKNAELWQALVEAAAPHRIDWRWGKGHAGHAENERVDRLASAAAEAARR